MDILKKFGIQVRPGMERDAPHGNVNANRRCVHDGYLRLSSMFEAVNEGVRRARAAHRWVPSLAEEI